jgi:hydroxypyruvate reductase
MAAGRGTKKSRLRRDALTLFRAAVRAADPGPAVAASLIRRRNGLEVWDRGRWIDTLDLAEFDRVWILAVGKAAAPMARAGRKILGAKFHDGIVVVKTGHAQPAPGCRVFEAGHPIPDEAGRTAAEHLRGMLEAAGENDLVLSLVSGGASALAPLPVPGVSLADKRTATGLLLASGAGIHEINAVRKHLSSLKGGRMARLAAPARVVNLMLSDVVGDDMDVIGSGPFVPDPSTFEEAWKVLDRYGLIPQVPAPVRLHLEQGRAGRADETPKPGDPVFDRVTNLVVGSNRQSLRAVREKAMELGYGVLILTATLQGEAREAAGVLAAMAREIRASGHPVPPPACLISGGEPTVTLEGEGKGGRNQEFALAAALGIQGLENVVILAAGTDGTDGPTDAAGALVDGTTVKRAERMGLSAWDHLHRHDAYPFFDRLGDLIRTGPTRTNVMDVHLVLVG